ncbi:MAG: sugar phosphate isomerase/epimerase [Mariniblastus sp.]
METWPIGVFTSIDAGLGVDLDVAKELEIPTIQIHAPHAGNRTQATADEILERLARYGIRVTAVFGGFDGESYADIPTVVNTVGLVPLDSRAARLAEMKEISDFANMMGCDVIALHLGFVPHDNTDPGYADIVAVTKELCEYAAAHGQALHLETGQETAAGLVQFIDDTGCDNLFVNFDPANMILYGAGNPIEALELLGDRVKSVHCKDAKWAKNPGAEWGEETKLGLGDVNMSDYLKTLKKIGYTGPLTIEREIPQEPDRQKEEIGHAVSLLKQLKSELA